MRVYTMCSSTNNIARIQTQLTTSHNKFVYAQMRVYTMCSSTNMIARIRTHFYITQQVCIRACARVYNVLVYKQYCTYTNTT